MSILETPPVIIIALISGLGAGLVAILATIAIERLGGHMGGIIGTLPTTIIPASWGLWQPNLTMNEGIELHMSQAYQGFEAAMYAVPAGMCLNAIFLWLWRIIPQRSYFFQALSQKQSIRHIRVIVILMSIVTLGLWSVGAAVWVKLSRQYLDSPSLKLYGGLGATAIIILIGLLATRVQQQAPKGTNQVSLSTLLFRGLCAMVAVSVAVYISKTGATTIAGVAAVFPAIFWTTMVSLWLSQGQAVPAGAVGPMMIGSSSVAVFALTAPYFYLHGGTTWGALGAWCVAAAFASLPSYVWVKWVQKSPDKKSEDTA